MVEVPAIGVPVRRTQAKRPIAREILTPWLVDPAGNPIYSPVTVWAVFRGGSAVTPIVAVPGTPWTIEPGRLSHIINRHSDAARNRVIKQIAAGQAQATDYQNVGYFFPQYSTPQAIIQLIADVYDAAGPADISPNSYGDLAIVAGALYMQETSTKATAPILVGLNGLYGNPTNQVVLIAKPDNSVSTMYPIGNVRPFVP